MKRLFYMLFLAAVGLMLTVGLLCAQEETQGPNSALAEEVQEAQQTQGMTFWQIIKSGGLAMIAIGLCSVAVVSITVERIINTQTKKLIPGDLVHSVSMLAKDKKFDDAKVLCEQNPSLISNILKSAIEKLPHGRKIILQTAEESGGKEMSYLQQRIVYLSVIAVISPMIGLLGTVIGMIQSFNVIAFQGGAGRPTLLAAGISKALVTTAFGLIVAIPSMLFFYYFKIKIQRLMAKTEDIAQGFIDIISPVKAE